MDMTTNLSAVLLAAFAGLSAVDGLYIHLWSYRLHARADSRTEHLLHTGRAVLFPAILWLLYRGDPAGWILWTGVSLALLDTILELADVGSEPASRADLGGLGAVEAVLHAALITLRSASVVLILAARPSSAWDLSAVGTGTLVAPLAQFVTRLLMPGAIGVAVLHAWLALPRTEDARKLGIRHVPERGASATSGGMR